MKLISCIFFFLCLSTQAQDCNKYKTGTFEIDNLDGTISVIKRTKKFQTESNGEIKTKDRIVWLNECSYKLIPVRIKDKSGLIGDDILTFTIIKTFDHSYVVQIRGLEDMVFEAQVFEQGYLGETE